MDGEAMRIAVMGSGAVGGYFGARLAAAGKAVAFVARGKHLEAMRARGLEIQSVTGDFRAAGTFSGEPREIGPVELILFCVKSYDTDAAAAQLAPMMGDRTVVLSLQNGVDNGDKIAARWGARRVLGGVVYLGAALEAPGLIRHSSGGRIVLGALDGAASEAAEAAAAVFAAAGVPCAVSGEIRKVMWSKLAWNAPFCALSCLARATVREILESESLRRLATACIEEVREAAHVSGSELAPSIVDDTFNFSRGLGGFKPSMLQDLEAGKPLEYEALNGVVVEVLRTAGKSAPVNAMCRDVLAFLDNRTRAG